MSLQRRTRSIKGGVTLLAIPAVLAASVLTSAPAQAATSTAGAGVSRTDVAAEPSQGVRPDTQVSQVNQDRSVKWLTSQVTIVKLVMKRGADGQVRFDANRAVALGADSTFVRDFGVGVNSTTTATSLAACRGENRYISHWWGPEGWLNSCVSDNISILLVGGAALSTITGALLVLSGVGAPASAIAPLATGLFGLGAVAVKWCNRDGTGIKVFKLWVGQPFVCTTQ